MISHACLYFLTLCLQVDEQALPATVHLPGPRQVEAIVDRSDIEWVVKLRMQSVCAFDSTLNARLNREKGRQFALLALAKLLANKSDSVLEATEVNVTDARLDGTTFFITLHVPRQHLRVTKANMTGSSDVVKSSVQFTFGGTIFTRKADLLKTFDFLTEAMESDADTLLGLQNEGAFPNGIVDLEVKADAAFKACTSEVQNDKLLLQLEKEELHQVIETHQCRFAEYLKTTVSKQETLKHFRDVTIIKPFDNYLLKNLLLMETTGAKIIYLNDHRQLLLGVASTTLKNSSPSEKLRAEKVCRIKALANIVGEQEGIKIFRTEKLEERDVVVSENSKETAKSVSEYLQITKSTVEGWTQGMPVVGRWKSKEGDVFYLAVGLILDKHGCPISP